MNANDLIATLSETMADDASIDLDAAVEHCPGWKVRDLVVHIGDVQRFWADTIERRVTADAALERFERGAHHGDPVGRFRSESARLVRALRSTPDHTAIWTWWPPAQHVAFVRRRQLIEVAVHGWDASNAVGIDRPIPVEVAIVGIQEFADVMAHDLRDDVAAPRPIRLVCTDADVRIVLFDDGSLPATLEGTASDLLLTLWGRRPITDSAIATSLAALDLS